MEIGVGRLSWTRRPTSTQGLFTWQLASSSPGTPATPTLTASPSAGKLLSSGSFLLVTLDLLDKVADRHEEQGHHALADALSGVAEGADTVVHTAESMNAAWDTDLRTREGNKPGDTEALLEGLGQLARRIKESEVVRGTSSVGTSFEEAVMEATKEHRRLVENSKSGKPSPGVNPSSDRQGPAVQPATQPPPPAPPPARPPAPAQWPEQYGGPSSWRPQTQHGLGPSTGGQAGAPHSPQGWGPPRSEQNYGPSPSGVHGQGYPPSAPGQPPLYGDSQAPVAWHRPPAQQPDAYPSQVPKSSRLSRANEWLCRFVQAVNRAAKKVVEPEPRRAPGPGGQRLVGQKPLAPGQRQLYGVRARPSTPGRSAVPPVQDFAADTKVPPAAVHSGGLVELG